MCHVLYPPRVLYVLQPVFLTPRQVCGGDMEAPPVGGHRTGGGGPDGSHAVDWGTRLRASTKATKVR